MCSGACAGAGAILSSGLFRLATYAEAENRVWNQRCVPSCLQLPAQSSPHAPSMHVAVAATAGVG